MPRLRLILSSALFAVFSAAGAVSAQPAPREIGPTVADVGSAYYGFERLSVASRDAERTYRVQIGIPRKPAGPSGYPVVWMLDGDAAMARLDEALLERLNAGDPPVLVAIGYQGDRQFNVTARAYDYTPPSADGSVPVDAAGRPGGGADVFLALLHDRIQPEVARRAPLDMKRSLFWGHSYGGLCVLHAALTRPDGFSAYVAASPSLWWNYGAVLDEVDPFLAAPRPDGFSLALMVGEQEASGRSGRRHTHPMWNSVPSGATRDLAMRLGSGGVRVRYSELAGQGHGGALGASLIPTLLTIARVGPETGELLQ